MAINDSLKAKNVVDESASNHKKSNYPKPIILLGKIHTKRIGTSWVHDLEFRKLQEKVTTRSQINDLVRTDQKWKKFLKLFHCRNLKSGSY